MYRFLGLISALLQPLVLLLKEIAPGAVALANGLDGGNGLKVPSAIRDSGVRGVLTSRWQPMGDKQNQRERGAQDFSVDVYPKLGTFADEVSVVALQDAISQFEAEIREHWQAFAELPPVLGDLVQRSQAHMRSRADTALQAGVWRLDQRRTLAYHFVMCNLETLQLLRHHTQFTTIPWACPRGLECAYTKGSSNGGGGLYDMRNREDNNASAKSGQRHAGMTLEQTIESNVWLRIFQLCLVSSDCLQT
jgi:hypothetical protein